MTTYLELSPVLHAVFAIWSLLLCLLAFLGLITALQNRKIRMTLYSAGVILVAYTFRQTALDLSLLLLQKKTSPHPLSMMVGNWSVWIWFVVFFGMTLLIFLVHLKLFRFSRDNVTPVSIVQCTDLMDSGICYWNDQGRVIFTNKCMNRLCSEITDAPLLNGNTFRQAVQSGVIRCGDQFWDFSCKNFLYEGIMLHEMIATNVTESFQKTEELKKNAEKLKLLTEELRRFSINIDEMVRKEEILRAKVSIHDEINRLMLTSDSVDPADTVTLDKIFFMWEKNAMLLSMEQDVELEAISMEQLREYSQALGIRLIWEDPIPYSFGEEEQSLFYMAAREALANAAKHANAATMEVRIEELQDQICCHFVNDGILPDGEVAFTGGLNNLVQLSRKQNATVSACTEQEHFVLTLCFQRQN